MNFAKKEVQTVGVSSVSLVRDCDPKILPSGITFPLDEIGTFTLSDGPSTGISPIAWEMVQSNPTPDSVAEIVPPADVLRLAEERQSARERKDWAAADTYRKELAILGWVVQDTPDGPKLTKS
jgi:hypothetical protein